MTSPEKQSHTAEPWECDDEAQVCAFNQVVAQCDLSMVGDANARRIVAAVNACTGIPTDRLEKTAALGGIKQVLERAGNNTLERDRLREQRDQLVEALKFWIPDEDVISQGPVLRTHRHKWSEHVALLAAIQSQEKKHG